MVAAGVTRNLLALVLTAAFAVSCVSSTPPQVEKPTPTSTASLPTSAATPPSPPGALRTETPAVLLDVQVAPAVDHPGVTTPRPGGGSQNGPTALAVDGAGSMYLWDEARLRIVVYEKGGRYARDIPLPSVSPEAEALLIHAGRLYLREKPFSDSTLEYEVDLVTGRVLRVASGPASIYPRTRVGRALRLPGAQLDLGGDALGFRYRYDQSTSTRLLQRLDASGNVLVQSVDPVSPFLVDTYVASDGALYGLVDRALADGHVYVYRLLSSAGGAPAEQAAAEGPAPVIAGVRVPDDVAVIYVGLPGAKLAAREREVLWRTLALTRPTPDQHRITPILRFQATWSDGRKSEIASDGHVATIDGVTQTPVLPGLDTLAAWSASRPADLAFHASRGTVVQIPDFTEGAATTTRYLTRTEADALVAAIGGSVWERERAVPRPLEDPVPRVHLTLGGIVTLQPVGTNHLALGRSGGLAAPGLETLVRSLAPAAPTTGIAALYGATALTITDRTGAQDLSRWKATVVRALLGAETHPPGEPTATFTLAFTLPGGRREEVAVDEGGFTYLGRRYARAGLTYLLGLRGVP